MKLPPNHRLQVTFTGDGEVAVRYYVATEFGPPKDRQTATTNRDLVLTAAAKAALSDILGPLILQNAEAMETLAYRDSAQLAYVTTVQSKIPELAKASLATESHTETPDASAGRHGQSRRNK